MRRRQANCVLFLCVAGMIAIAMTMLRQCNMTHDPTASTDIHVQQNDFRFKLTDPLFNIMWSGKNKTPSQTFMNKPVTESQQPNAQQEKLIESSHSDVDMHTYKTALDLHSDDHQWIVLALADEGTIDTALNFYITSLKRHGISNYLIIASDNKTCGLLRPYDINCYMYLRDKDAGHPSNYNSKDFLRKMHIRSFMILDALRLGFNVLHTDMDVYYMKNPFQHFEYYKTTYDLAPLYDWSAHNAGFLFIWASNNSIAVYKQTCHIGKTEPNTVDQSALNRAISSTKKNTSLKVQKLPDIQFQCGKKFWGASGEKNTFAPNCSECVVVHNNWIVSMEAKRYRFREVGFWEEDSNGYYSNPKAKYLMFDNEVILDDTFKEEMNALQNAFAIGQILNRTVILPKFHCGKKRCTLQNHIKIRNIEKQFPNYRESTFLQNPLVPESIKLSKSPEIVITSSTYVDISERDSRDENTNVRVYTPLDNKNGADSGEILKWFADEKSSILQFDNLYGSFSGFVDKNEQKIFEKRVKDGFVKGNYMQV